MRFDLLRLGLKNIWQRKLRSILTVIGIFIGIATVVALISLGQGMQEAIEDQFEILGTDKIFVLPTQIAIGGESEVGLLTMDDVDYIKRINGVKAVSWSTFRTGRIEFGDEQRFYLVVGLPSGEDGDLFREGNIVTLLKGRDLEENDHDKVIVGYHYHTRKILGKNVNLRDRLTINGKRFTVIGVYDRIGNPADDSQLYITGEASREILDLRQEEVSTMIVQADNPLKVSERIRTKLRRHRGLEEGKEDFDISTPEELLETFGQVLDVVQIVLVAIALISLIVGSVGIMNTMYTSIYERRKEIGVMKAIGARNSDILFLALFESGALGLIGGILGFSTGWGFSAGVEYLLIEYYDFTLLGAYMSWELMAAALIFSFLLGAISGALPAYQASLLKPVESIRSN